MAALSFDPRDIPVEAIAGEPALAPERLQIDWLRARFLRPVQWVPEIIEDRSLRHLHEPVQPIAAAVMLSLIDYPSGPALLLTQRTAHLNNHAGQVSLPGGRTDAGDATAIETALRETEEEIGLHRRHIDVIGSLPEYVTGTGYCITPVVSIAQPPFELTAAPYEVEEIFEVPLAFLMNGMHHQRRTIDFGGEMGRRSFYSMPYQDYFIWGATAGMLRNLFHFLRA